MDTDKDKVDLKDIALELLEKYQQSEEAVIYEFSSSIEGHLQDLQKEVDKYKERIEKA